MQMRSLCKFSLPNCLVTGCRSLVDIPMRINRNLKLHILHITGLYASFSLNKYKIGIVELV